MNWPFWTRTQPSDSEHAGLDTCDTLDALLSLYADRMASPEEARRVEAHLPDCEGCRESLQWMQATRRALASRPMALPPAGLQAQIARAIAASAASPVAALPVRTFSLRPAYAAAASLTVLGAILAGHSLLTARVGMPTANASKVAAPRVASVPPASLSEPTAPPTLIRPLAVNHSAPERVKLPPQPAERVAAVPDAAAVPAEMPSTPRVETAPALSSPAKHSVRLMSSRRTLLPAQLSATYKAPDALMAARVPAPKAPESAPPVAAPVEKTSAPVIASNSVTPTVTIGAPTVTPQEPSAVQVAAREHLLDSVKQHIGVMQTAAYSTTRKSIKDAAFLAETGLPEKTPGVAITEGGWH